ncbi:MAG: FHA domain-containing protein [Actinomycetota bacterium]
MAYLEIEGTGERLGLDDKAEYTLGRVDSASNYYPDIDLASHGAVDAGVSRRHAKITRVGEGRHYIMDLSSTNYTHVNEDKLEPFEPRVLADEDEIHLGTLKLIFHH